jgi:AcrR family transcriptional regulator
MATQGRVSAAQRRESMLRAAVEVFAGKGYNGATTYEIARVAQVSQALVVRAFGTKEQLFYAVAEQAVDELIETFRGVLKEAPTDARAHRIRQAYLDRLPNDALSIMLWSQLLGSEPTIGAKARAGFLRLYRFLREDADLSAREAGDLIADCQFAGIVSGLRFPEDQLAELRFLIRTGDPTDPLPAVIRSADSRNDQAAVPARAADRDRGMRGQSALSQTKEKK